LVLRAEYDANDYQHEGLENRFSQSAPINFGLDYRPLKTVDFGLGYERGNKLMARVAIQMNLQDFRGPAKTQDPPPPPPRASESVQPTAAPERSIAEPSPPSVAVQPPTPLPGTEPIRIEGRDGITLNPKLELRLHEAGGAQPASPQPASPRPPVNLKPASLEAQKDFVVRLKKALKAQGFSLIAVDYLEEQREVVVWLAQNRYRNPARALGRSARVLSATSPADIERFTVVNVERGVETYRASVPRRDFERAARGELDADEALATVDLSGPGGGYDGARFYDATRLPGYSWDMGPAIRQSVGGADNFYLGQLYWKLGGELDLSNHFSLSAAGGFNIINNFDQLKQQSNSVLPHVRSDIGQYLKQGANGLIRLEGDYIWSPAPDLYARLSAGIFEEMYGGVAGEVLYRPYGRRWAIGLDANYLRQRDFNEQFDFRSYKVATGFVRFYYQLPFYDILAKLSVGRYLAKDKGATLDLSREFASGVRAGIFATKTNISAAQFGEGSFDKGIYIQLPLDLFFPKSSRRVASLSFRPLTRDGGQMAYDGKELYPLVSGGQPGDFAHGARDWLK
jgi:hypothetical protein